MSGALVLVAWPLRLRQMVVTIYGLGRIFSFWSSDLGV